MGRPRVTSEKRAVKGLVAKDAGGDPQPQMFKQGKEHVVRARLEVDERRAQLLALGLTIFSERSYDEVAIDDIARAAGVSKGLLYHYFPTKRDFYVAALRATARALIEQTIGADNGGDEERGERLRRGLTTYLDFVERRGGAYVALMRGGIGSDPEVASILEETRVAILEHIVALLPPGVKGPLATTALRGWIGFVEAASIDWVARRSVTLEQIVELAYAALFDVLMRAVAITHGGPAPVLDSIDRSIRPT